MSEMLHIRINSLSYEYINHTTMPRLLLSYNFEIKVVNDYIYSQSATFLPLPENTTKVGTLSSYVDEMAFLFRLGAELHKSQSSFFFLILCGYLCSFRGFHILLFKNNNGTGKPYKYEYVLM